MRSSVNNMTRNNLYRWNVVIRGVREIQLTYFSPYVIVMSHDRLERLMREAFSLYVNMESYNLAFNGIPSGLPFQKSQCSFQLQGVPSKCG